VAGSERRAVPADNHHLAGAPGKSPGKGVAQTRA
jgi:hypothetical protein